MFPCDKKDTVMSHKHEIKLNYHILLTAGLIFEKIDDVFLFADDFDGRDANGESGASVALLFADQPKEPRDGARNHSQTMRRLGIPQHRVRFAWRSVRYEKFRDG